MTSPVLISFLGPVKDKDFTGFFSDLTLIVSLIFSAVAVTENLEENMEN